MDSFSIVCVFDGTAHKLKREQAYDINISVVMVNTWKHTKKFRNFSYTIRCDVMELHSIDSAADEKRNVDIDRVKSLRKGLSYLRSIPVDRITIFYVYTTLT